jgi:hypothetical protein
LKEQKKMRLVPLLHAMQLGSGEPQLSGFVERIILVVSAGTTCRYMPFVFPSRF